MKRVGRVFSAPVPPTAVGASRPPMMIGATKKLTLSTSPASRNAPATCAPPSTSTLRTSHGPRAVAARPRRSRPPLASLTTSTPSAPRESCRARVRALGREDEHGKLACRLRQLRARAGGRASRQARRARAAAAARFQNGQSTGVVRRGCACADENRVDWWRSSWTRARDSAPVIQRESRVRVAIFPSSEAGQLEVYEGARGERSSRRRLR